MGYNVTWVLLLPSIHLHDTLFAQEARSKWLPYRDTSLKKPVFHYMLYSFDICTLYLQSIHHPHVYLLCPTGRTSSHIPSSQFVCLFALSPSFSHIRLMRMQTEEDTVANTGTIDKRCRERILFPTRLLFIVVCLWTRLSVCFLFVLWLHHYCFSFRGLCFLLRLLLPVQPTCICFHPLYQVYFFRSALYVSYRYRLAPFIVSWSSSILSLFVYSFPVYVSLCDSMIVSCSVFRFDSSHSHPHMHALLFPLCFNQLACRFFRGFIHMCAFSAVFFRYYPLFVARTSHRIIFSFVLVLLMQYSNIYWFMSYETIMIWNPQDFTFYAFPACCLYLTAHAWAIHVQCEHPFTALSLNIHCP